MSEEEVTTAFMDVTGAPDPESRLASTLTSVLHITTPPKSSDVHTLIYSNITDTMEGNVIGMTPADEESVYGVVLGVSIIAVLMVILFVSIVLVRYISHQKGTYYTNEEDFVFKSDPDMQEIPESPEYDEDSEVAEDDDS
ncbi:hypothetical protein DNTS_021675 [Danionella cerebrum]|uniref:Neurexin/syndecan/glycophorin C domain-containing protein n=1 Tax=Danionella cerebrum TaxID=2873325 RepID=A0A553NWF3_9TELE|nr:hypothetical protein DNTS_021675 [Danionella translucida]